MFDINCFVFLKKIKKISNTIYMKIDLFSNITLKW